MEKKKRERKHLLFKERQDTKMQKEQMYNQCGMEGVKARVNAGN